MKKIRSPSFGEDTLADTWNVRDSCVSIKKQGERHESLSLFS